jgi:hypothetical protein
MLISKPSPKVMRKKLSKTGNHPSWIDGCTTNSISDKIFFFYELQFGGCSGREKFKAHIRVLLAITRRGAKMYPDEKKIISSSSLLALPNNRKHNNGIYHRISCVSYSAHIWGRDYSFLGLWSFFIIPRSCINLSCSFL